MGNGNETLSGNPQNAIVSIVKKEGILGLVLVALMYFIWSSHKDNRADAALIRPVLEKNTEAISKNSVVQEATQNVMKEAIKSGATNNEFLKDATKAMDKIQRRL
jgi:hypothetical protein